MNKWWRSGHDLYPIDYVSSYGLFVRQAPGACVSGDSLYLIHPRINSGHSGTTGVGSVFSGNRPHSAGWCQHSSCSLLSRCSRMPVLSLLTSVMSCSRVICPRSASMIRFLSNACPEIDRFTLPQCAFGYAAYSPGNPAISRTGRTSIVPMRPPGTRAAMPIASLRSLASIRK